MKNVSPFRTSTAALFSPQGKAAKPDATAALKAAVQKAVGLKAAERTAMADRVAAAPPMSTRNEWERITPESLAAAEAAFAEWEANEQRVAAEIGFRREANSMILGMYAHAKTGVFGTAAINTRAEMNDHLDRFFYGFQSDVALINQSGGSLTVGDAFKGYVERGLGEKGTAVFLARAQDHLDARRMTLYAETAYVQKSLGLPHPVVTERDGKVSFTEQDITFQGKPFAHIGTDGSLTLLAANPDAGHPDPETLYLALDQRL